MQKALQKASQGLFGDLLRPRNLPRLWRLWRRYRLRPLQRRHLRNHIADARVPACERCPESCCKSPDLVPLRLSDIARLHDAGLGWAIQQPQPKKRLRIYQAHPELQHSEARDSFFAVLAQKPNGECVFLSEERRCEIYGQRPWRCRAFPYHLGDDGQSVRYARQCRTFDIQRPEEAERHLQAVVAHYNEKLKDLFLMELRRDALVAAGLGAYVRLKRFSEVLTQFRTGAEVRNTPRRQGQDASCK